MIIVVGGRIAGCTLSALLSQQGEDVLLLERQNMPGTVVSIATVLPDSLYVFDQFGFGAILDNMAYPRIMYLSFEFDTGVRVEGNMPESFERNWAFGIRRETLDHLLLTYVRHMPRIIVKEGFKVSGVLWEDGKVVGVKGSSLRGKTEKIRGDLVIGADGRLSSVARAVNALIYDQRPSRTCLYYTYFSDVVPFNAQPSLVTYKAEIQFPIHIFTQEAEDGLTGVGVEGPSIMFSWFRQNTESAFHTIIQNVPGLALRMQRAKRETRIMGIRTPDMFYRKPYGQGWALVGDAGLHFDPVTGQGLSQATASAFWLSRAISEWRHGKSFESSFSAYHKIRDSKTKSNYERAYQASDFYSIIPPWTNRWYAWMGHHPLRSRPLLRMLSNAVPPDQFFTPWRRFLAYFRHYVLYEIRRRVNLASTRCISIVSDL